MDKEMEFKNKSIKEKVNGSFEMIIVLYVVSVAFAVFLMFAVKIVPSATEYFVLAGGIVVLAIITVCSILATLKRAKMLIHYIVEPVRELSSVAEKISGGELDIEIAYQSEDEIGELAEDFRKTATTLQRIIGDLNHILDAFAKGDYTVKSGCRDAYVAEARVYHSHNYSCAQQFHRNFDLGVSQAEHPEVFEGVPSEGEGIRLVKKSMAYLTKTGHIWMIPGLFFQSAAKYAGYFLGKRYKKLPEKLILFCTMSPEYWKKKK